MPPIVDTAAPHALRDAILDGYAEFEPSAMAEASRALATDGRASAPAALTESASVTRVCNLFRTVRTHTAIETRAHMMSARRLDRGPRCVIAATCVVLDDARRRAISLTPFAFRHATFLFAHSFRRCTTAVVRQVLPR